MEKAEYHRHSKSLVGNITTRLQPLTTVALGQQCKPKLGGGGERYRRVGDISDDGPGIMEVSNFCGRGSWCVRPRCTGGHRKGGATV